MFFGSAECLVDFNKAEVQHILNHSMILLDTKSQQQKAKARFIFDNRWIKMNGYTEVIYNSWNLKVKGSRMFKLHKKIMHYRKRLLEWRKKENTNSRIQIQCIKREMESMQNLGGQREWDNWHSLKSQLEVAYRVEKENQARKSRVEWLQEGDTNNRFFHTVTSQRRMRNRIERLENQGGDICEGEQAVSEVISDYFKNIFTTADPVGRDCVLDRLNLEKDHRYNECSTY